MHITRRTALWLFIPIALLLLLFLWPLPRSFLHPTERQSVRILDRNGKLLYEVRPRDFGSHQFLHLPDIPQSFVRAVLSIEDRDFYDHSGVSAKAVSRAVLQNVTAGRIVSGGSTITQQLVRSRVQPERRTFLYKIYEAFLAWKLDHALSKDDILESYINTASFGHQTFGIDAASHTYFGVSPQELSVAQSALLAGLLQSPTSLDPFLHPKAAKDRRTRVLDAMLVTESITREQYDDAIREPIALSKDTVPIEAPHFVFWLQESRPELFLGRSTVQTTLDLPLEQEIERIIDRNLQLLAGKNVTSSAVVVLDVHTGDLLAMVGSADYFDIKNEGAVNVAVSPRQPGSALKPFTYALAMAAGDTPATTVSDTETQFFTGEGNPYTPRNYDFGFHGLVRYREALANSYNIAAVKVLEKVGVSTLLEFLKHAGITSFTNTPNHYGLALTLGDAEVSLLELTKVYGIFPRLGKTLSVRSIKGDPIDEGVSILDEKVAWFISNILSDSSARLPEFGDESPLNFPFPVAAKTGTTRNSRDNWTIGFTPDILVGVWVGNADNSPMQGTSGVTGAGPIFHDVMIAATAEFPPRPFPMLRGITQVPICVLSGKLPTPECTNTMLEYFIEGKEPKEKDDMFRSVIIDRRNGLLATPLCPQEFINHTTFAVFPKDTQKWARENGWPEVPTKNSPLCGGIAGVSQSSSEAHFMDITQPHGGDSFELDPLIPDKDEGVILEAEASADIKIVSWFVNGEKIADALAPDFHTVFHPQIGRFVIEARTGGIVRKVSIEVTKKSVE